MRRKFTKIQNARKPRPTARPIRLGFVPLNDCAPLVMASERGLFARFGLDVRLSRELGWATVRDKLVHGELDAAHAPCGLPLALALGHNCGRTDTITALVLNLNGNAITLSEELWDAGVRDAATLREYLISGRGRRTLTFGTVSPHSTHTFLLRRWLTEAGADFTRDVRFVVSPPPQMPGNLASGHLDGFCAGEPWNSVAVAEGSGWIAATSAELAPLHPEKVLLTTAGFAVRHEAEHLRLVAALIEACALCDDPGNHAEIAQLLSDRRFVGRPAAVIARGFPGEFTGDFDLGHGRRQPLPDFTLFHRENANEPSADKAAWIAQHLLDGAARAAFTPAQLAHIFRADLFAQAQALRIETIPHETIRETRLLTA